MTGEVYVRKVIETKDESVADLLKRHLNENVLSYFRRRDRCTLLDVAPQCIEVLASKNTPGTLYVSRVFIRGKSLRELLKNNSAMVARRHIGFMARQMLSILLDYGGHTDWIMTLDNLFVDSCGSIKPNYTSFVGLAFLKLNQSIRLEEFAEIYPYLDHRTIAKETGRMIDRQLQIRSLAVNLLAILIGRDLRL